MDKIFDILNSHNPFGKGYKSPLTRNNLSAIEKHLDQSLSYLENLKLMDGKLFTETKRRTFIIGLRTAANSFIGVAKFTFNKFPNSKYILAYKLGQDHIETLFSKIRSKSGFNNNPDVLNFKSALKSLLVKSDISANPNANSIDLETASEGSLLIRSLGKRHKKAAETDDEDYDDTFDDDAFSLELPKLVTDVTEYIGKG